ncbi:MAG: tetratricopeptide repeat protein [Pyrinomonadaceae bacterium]|nr:tetratricopeptide repeat protein [Sphingobacteriaceae bacterium]
MTTRTFYRILIFLFLPLTTFSQTSDNVELKKMYDEDQASRRTPSMDWILLTKNDSIREKRVYELINEGKIITGKDFYHSAMIFQHGKDSVAYGMAVKQMRRAIELDSTLNKWLLAAAIDRDLMSREMPQIYGTQYIKQGQTAKWERYKIDTTIVTDQQRKFYNVETLAEQKEKERTMNLMSISEYNSTATNIDNTIGVIKAEKAKGVRSSYNVSESAINSFGYGLLNSGRKDDALKIFTLNTELYPYGFNTWDSLGECLLKLNKKEAGLTAYKKSLEFNPNNKNAIKALSGEK